MSDFVRRIFLSLSGEDRQAAAERANREPDFWNPYIESFATAEARRERAATLRRVSRELER